MTSVEIYTKPTCGFCHAAKRLLSSKGIAMVEIDLAREPQRRAEMIQRAGGRTTVPQVFLGETHVGDCTELYRLERAGELDGLLQA